MAQRQQHPRSPRNQPARRKRGGTSQPRRKKEPEEPEAPTYWIQEREDTDPSDETYRRIDLLRTNYPLYWRALMKYEKGFLTDEEALKEMEEAAGGQLVEATQAEKPQERTPQQRTRALKEQDAAEQSRNTRRSSVRSQSRGRHVRAGKAMSASPERRVRKR